LPQSKNDDNDKKALRLKKIKDVVIGFSGALAVVGGVSSGNPLLAIGGSTAVFGSIVSPFINKRREEWFENLLLDYDKLSKKMKNLDLEKILKDEKVVDALIQASLIAIKTRHEEKRKFLRNAILNISQGSNIESDMQTMYFQWMDELTLTHIQLLLFFNEPSKWGKNNDEDWKNKFKETFDINEYFSDKFPKINEYEQYCRDLYVKGLFHILHHKATHEENEMWRNPLSYSWTSDLGKKFLKFIKNPI